VPQRRCGHFLKKDNSLAPTGIEPSHAYSRFSSLIEREGCGQTDRALFYGTNQHLPTRTEKTAKDLQSGLTLRSLKRETV
jgi:hypothetical protein